MLHGEIEKLRLQDLHVDRPHRQTGYDPIDLCLTARQNRTPRRYDTRRAAPTLKERLDQYVWSPVVWLLSALCAIVAVLFLVMVLLASSAIIDANEFLREVRGR